MVLRQYAIVKIAACYTLGILFASYSNISMHWLWSITLVLTIVLGSLYLIAKKQLFQDPLFGTTTFVIFFFFGVLNYQLQLPKNDPSHYSYHIKKEQNYNVKFEIKERLRTTAYYNRYKISLKQLNGQKVKGFALLNIYRDSTSKILDQSLLYHAIVDFKEIKPPLNPHQFNYKNYLEKEGVYYQLYVANTAIKYQKRGATKFKNYAFHTRSIILKSLEKSGFSENTLSIIAALLLGQRQDISRTIYTNYTDAGAIHILAISGLHIGIIMWLLHLLLSPIAHLKKGKKIKSIAIMIILWSFAYVSGFSPSVVRSVIMFSFFSYAIQRNKITTIYPILINAAFITLLIHPILLFDVGFQLSYAAVFAIVSIHPFFLKLWNPNWFIVKHVWQILSVSCAAQLGVLPLSLYYFHQFPGLFFLTNLIVIPLVGIILIIGIFIALWSILSSVPQFVVSWYSALIKFMNTYIEWIASQDVFIFKNIYFDKWLILFGYSLLILLFSLFNKKSNKKFFLLFSVLILMLIQQGYERKKRLNKHTFIVFHKSLASYNAIHKAATLTLLPPSNEVFEIPLISNYVRDERIKQLKKINHIEANSIIREKLIVFIDSSYIYRKNEKADYLILQQSPKVNLERIVKVLRPKIVIADGSNYRSFIKRWEKTCEKTKTPFHYTGDKGAYILDLN